MLYKTMVSPCGRKYAISDHPRETDNGVVFLTKREHEYIQRLGLKGPEFTYCLQAKLEDFMWPIIPDGYRNQRQEECIEWARRIKEQLARGFRASLQSAPDAQKHP
jgi:hypothetical protein